MATYLGSARRSVQSICALAMVAFVSTNLPGLAQSSSPTPTTTVPIEEPAIEQPAIELAGDVANPEGVEFDTSQPATPITIGGTAVSVPTDGSANFVFTASAGQAIHVRANRPWSLQDPLGQPVLSGGNTVRLLHTGRYLLNLQKGLLAPAVLSLAAVSPTPVILTGSVGQPIGFSAAERREQYARVAVQGGHRYQLIAEPGQGATFCAQDRSGLIVELGCVTSDRTAVTAPSTTFVPLSDQSITLTIAYDPNEAIPTPTARVEELAGDLLIDPEVTPISEVNPETFQRAVIPFWGTPAQRAVLSSPVAANVRPWGQPWIDKEAGAQGTSVRVYATPVSFVPTLPPFVAWGHTSSAQRFGVYRGEDTAAAIPANGQPVAIRNKAWFAAVGSLNVEPGGRYVLQVSGNGLRPVSLGLRDPAGKLTSNFAPWQWTEDGAQQRAVTSFTADRGGKWALEIRPSGNAVKDLAISLLKVGSGGSYEGAVDVDDVLKVGDETDVQLSPNEFARFTLKLDDATPQIIQPEVLKYRNRTFQASAVDMSLWDSRGRLVWSNNRTVDEEVLSGRLGTERDLTERFATVAAADAYTLIIDPLVNVSGRFRVSVKSSPVVSDVGIGAGPIPQLPGGTHTGVVEVRTPTRYQLLGGEACLEVTSNSELGRRRPCLQPGDAITLPIGVHRFRFGNNSAAARFSAVEAGTPSAVPVVSATLGQGFSIPTGASIGTVRFEVAAGTRITLDGLSGVIVEPDGTVRPVDDGLFVASMTGVHVFRTGQRGSSNPVRGTIRRAPVEIATTVLKVGAAKSSVYSLVSGTRLEATVVVPPAPKGFESGVAFDLFAVSGANIEFAYAADDKERRYFGDQSGVILPPDRYRFVFTGDGSARIRLARPR